MQKIIVGLGNPGSKYEKTRHNAGFMAVDYLAEKLGAVWQLNKKFNAFCAEADGLILTKPQTFMNCSGEPVYKILNYYKLLDKTAGLIRKKDQDLSEVLTVVHDDLDIELGKFKISIDSRSAGHNGVQSIIDRLKTKKFTRVRLGIKAEKVSVIGAEKFVLQKFIAEENKIILEVIRSYWDQKTPELLGG
jgi:peptidyl-tRNA hydrolase, PTH1 family